MNLRLLILFLLLSSAGVSQTLQQRVEKAFVAFENDPQLKYGHASLTVLNAATGETVFSGNGLKGLAPASTLKTVTALTAYHILGTNYTWNTTLGYSGIITADGTLQGNLIITGGGDPTLGSWRFAETTSEKVLSGWRDDVKNAGIKVITGKIIADDRLFGTQTLPGGWIWQDIGNYYGAGANSLSWHENQFDMSFKPGSKVGLPAELTEVSPMMPGIKIVNEVKTGNAGSGDNVYAYSAPYSNIVYLRGTYGIDLKKTISGSIPDPALQLANELTAKLENSSIKIAEEPTSARKLNIEHIPFIPAAKILSAYKSPELSKVIYWFNQKSINLYGEHLLKTIAWKEGKDITTGQGVDVLKQFWSKKLNLDEDELNIMDGSGLSPATRITTHAVATILQSARKEPWFPSFYESLPTYNNMRMKSGTIGDVLAYAGYETNKSGVPLVFSIMVNNYNGSSSAMRQKMYKLLDELK